MEIRTKFIKMLPELSGVSNGKDWVKNSFVTETIGEYPKKAVFTIWGETTDKVKGLKQGQEITVTFTVESR